MNSKQIWAALAILGISIMWYLIKPDYKLLNESGSRYVWRINVTTGEVCRFEAGYKMIKTCGGGAFFDEGL